MRLIDLLKAEHRRLKQFLNYLNVAAERIENKKPISPAFFEIIVKMTDFFVKGYHQDLEENLLFPYLKAKGLIEKGGPLEVLRREHEEADRYIKDLSGAAALLAGGGEEKRRARMEIVDNIRAYTHLMTAHTGKEEMVVFPIAETILSAEEEKRLNTEFEERMKRINLDLARFYQENLDNLQNELDESETEKEEIRHLWEIMHEDPYTVLERIDL